MGEAKEGGSPWFYPVFHSGAEQGRFLVANQEGHGPLYLGHHMTTPNKQDSTIWPPWASKYAPPCASTWELFRAPFRQPGEILTENGWVIELVLKSSEPASEVLTDLMVGVKKTNSFGNYPNYKRPYHTSTELVGALLYMHELPLPKAFKRFTTRH